MPVDNSSAITNPYDRTLLRNDAIKYILNDQVLSYELAHHICGKHLGQGCSRFVFEYLPDPSCVVKIEHGTTGANFMEWSVWQRIEHTDHAKWFAPVVSVSKNGSILIMKKAKPIRSIQEAPLHVPAFFTDLKIQNFGWMKHQCVCVDYASHMLMENGMTSRMQRAKWWEL